MYLERRRRNAFGPWMPGIPSGRIFDLPAASYSSIHADAGDHDRPEVMDGAVDTGNTAWVGMAFARYSAATGDSCYATVARDIMWALKTDDRCDDDFGGFMGRLAPTRTYYRSIEHNIDMFAFARMLGDNEDQESAGRLVTSMYNMGSVSGAYHIGTGGDYECDMSTHYGHIPTDAQAWSTAAGADSDLGHQTHAMQYMTTLYGDGLWEEDQDIIGNHGEQRGAKYQGVRFADGGAGVQFEVTSGAIMGMVEYQRRGGTHDVSAHIHAGRDSIKRLLQVYRTVPPSVRGGNLDAHSWGDQYATYPGGSDTGLGWTYLRYGHTASIAWAGMLLLFQPNDGAPIDNEGNPFSAPSQPVPAATQDNLHCLPEVAAAAPPECSANPGCAHLTHLTMCCPNIRGRFYGCCG
jgi:hypothetical protein